MSKTVQISNGDLNINSQGIVNTVNSINKAAQDVARHVLTDFSETFSEGSELNTLEDANNTFTESLIQQYLYEAVNRLIVKQDLNSDSDDNIVRVEDIKVRRVGLTTAVFYLEVLHESGEVVTLVDTVGQIKQTQLDHLFDVSGVVRI
jgi:hypothetical protein